MLDEVHLVDVSRGDRVADALHRGAVGALVPGPLPPADLEWSARRQSLVRAADPHRRRGQRARLGRIGDGGPPQRPRQPIPEIEVGDEPAGASLEEPFATELALDLHDGAKRLHMPTVTSGHVRAVVFLLGALALGPASHGSAAITVSTKAFGPDAGPLTISAHVDRSANLGVRLARSSGKPLGWIDAPSVRDELLVVWDGTLGGRPVGDGYYQAQLVAAGRIVASSGFKIDRKPALLEDLAVSSNSTRYSGDRQLFATLSPN